MASEGAAVKRPHLLFVDTSKSEANGFPVDLSVFVALEVSCCELLEFGVAYVVEDAAVNDLCAWSACSKD